MKKAILLLFLFQLAFAPAWSQFKHKKGKRVPKSDVSAAITTPVDQREEMRHDPQLDGYYPTEMNAEDKRTVKPNKFRKNQNRALRIEKRMVRREERAHKKRDRIAAKTQLANERNSTRKVRVRDSR